MGRFTPRKSRHAPALELLEDRRLLSLPGLPSAREELAPMVPDHADLAPPIWGPISAEDDHAFVTPDRDLKNFSNFETTPQGGQTFANMPDRLDQGSVTVGQADPILAMSNLGDQSGWAGELTSATSTDAGSTCPPLTVQDPSRSDFSSPSSSIFPPIVEAGNPGLTTGQAPSPGQTIQTAESFGQALPPSPFASIGSARTTMPVETADDRSLQSDQPLAIPTFATSFVLTSNHSATIELAFHQTSLASAVSPHYETGSDDSSEAANHPTIVDGTLALIGAIGPNSDALPIAGSRGSVSVGSINGLGSLASQARVSYNPGLSKGPGEGLAIAEDPSSPPLGSATSESPEGRPDLALVEIGEATDTPDPRLADLIVDLLPSGRASFEGIVDRFLEPLDGLSLVMPGWDASIGLLAASLTVAATVLAVEVTLRSRRDHEADGIDEEGGTLVDYPGLPSLGRGDL